MAINQGPRYRQVKEHSYGNDKDNRADQLNQQARRLEIWARQFTCMAAKHLRSFGVVSLKAVSEIRSTDNMPDYKIERKPSQ